MTRKELLDFYRYQLNEPLYITNKTDELDKEIQHNCWHIGIPVNLVNEISVDDILELINLVKEYYKRQLDASGFDIDLWFYLWKDEMAGQLRFNFINSNHKQLPFTCELNHVDDARQIIMCYLQDLGIEETALNVYSEIMIKKR